MYEGDETVVVTLGTPSGATLGSITTDTVTIVDNDTAPTVRFEKASQSAPESGGSMNVRVLLSAVSGSAVTVPYTVSGTATGGNVDYMLPGNSVVIPAGQLSEDLTIGLVNDTLNEDDETIVITMGTPSGAVLGSPSTHTATILDDDPLPLLRAVGGRGGRGGGGDGQHHCGPLAGFRAGGDGAVHAGR